MEYDWYYEWSYCREKAVLAENEVLITVPFCGTYCALSDLIDDEVEREAEWLIEEPQEGYEDGFYASFDMVSFLKDYVSYIGDCCGLPSLKFQFITSPREYNFSTDTIFASVDKNELWKLYEEIRPSKAYMAEVKKWTTPVSGYIPFYKPIDCYYVSPDDMTQECLLELILNAKMTHWLNDAYTDSDEYTTVNTMEILFKWIEDGNGLYEYLHF